MNSPSQSLPLLTSVSNVTRGMVAGFHFLVAAILVCVLIFSAKTLADTQLSRMAIGAVTLLILWIAFTYSAVGFGILRWKKWGRDISLALNWLNILASILNIARQRIGLGGGIGVVVSLFVVWWLNAPAVKARFKSAGGGEQ